MAKMFEVYVAQFQVDGIDKPLWLQQVVPDGVHPQDADASMREAAIHKATIELIGERPSLRRDGEEKVRAWRDQAALIPDRVHLLGIERVTMNGVTS